MVLLAEAEWSSWSFGSSGVAFVVLFLVSTFVGGGELGGPDQPAEIIARDLSENRLDGLRLASALIGLSASAGYWFVGGRCRRLFTVSSSAAPWVVLSGRIAMVTMVLATSAFAQAAIVVGSLALDPQAAKTLWLFEHGSWAMIGPPQVAFIVGVSVVAIGEADPPRWYGYSGVVVAVALAANMMWGLGSLAGLGLLWVLGLAVILWLHRPELRLAAGR